MAQSKDIFGYCFNEDGSIYDQQLFEDNVDNVINNDYDIEETHIISN